jgi:hypothetical protein
MKGCDNHRRHTVMKNVLPPQKTLPHMSCAREMKKNLDHEFKLGDKDYVRLGPFDSPI